MTTNTDQLVALIASELLERVFYDAMEVQGREVGELGSMDLRDGPGTNPRLVEGNKLALDLWFHAGRFPWSTPLETAVWERKEDGVFTPAGTYPMEKHTVVLVNPHSQRDHYSGRTELDAQSA